MSDFAAAAVALGVVAISIWKRLQPAEVDTRPRLSAEGGSVVDPHPETQVWCGGVDVVLKKDKGSTAVAARDFKKVVINLFFRLIA